MLEFTIKKFRITKFDWGWEGTDLEFAISILHIEWINNKVLVCITGNYIQ